MDNLTLRMVNAEAAILALQNLTASITGVLAGNLIEIMIGSENVLAGPLYESCLRRQDKKSFTCYIEAYGPLLSLPNNPVTAVLSSPVVTVSTASHGLSVGDRVQLSDLAEGRGFSSGDLYGDFVVASVPNVNSFTVALRRNATANGTFGGTVGLARKVNGRGMSTLWKSQDPSDTAVRVSNLGSKRYHFILRRLTSDVSNSSAALCYDKTDHAATFSTINAGPEGGGGNIICK